MKTNKIDKAKRRGWATSTTVGEPYKETKFEATLEALGLVDDSNRCENYISLQLWVEDNLQAWSKNTGLKLWAEKNLDDRYVPERLLQEWGLFSAWEEEPRKAEKTAATILAKHEPGYYSNYDDNDAWSGEFV